MDLIGSLMKTQADEVTNDPLVKMMITKYVTMLLISDVPA
jgi:hypothetical protein